ncbi:hypothetical protein [Streptomyces silaceus]|nr:hypothetical protein [Streptomyces silaceus]
MAKLDRAHGPGHRGHALLHRVEPVTGLSEADFAVVDGWLRRGREQPPS